MKELFKLTGQTAIGLMVTLPLLLELEGKRNVNYFLVGAAVWGAGLLVCWVVDNRRRIMQFIEEDLF